MVPLLPEIVEDEQLAAENYVTASDFELESTFGDVNRSAMRQSVRSSIYNYRYENRRPYQAYLVSMALREYYLQSSSFIRTFTFYLCYTEFAIVSPNPKDI